MKRGTSTAVQDKQDKQDNFSLWREEIHQEAWVTGEGTAVGFMVSLFLSWLSGLPFTLI